MRLCKITAMLMILIIISMPVYSATGILSYKITGRDNVNKAVRKNDMLKAEAVVNIEGDEISADQVWLGNNQFDSCVQDLNGYLCRIEYAGQRNFNEKEPFAISLHDDSHSSPPTSFTLVDSVSGYFVIDIYPPRIRLDYKTKSAGNFDIGFNAYDDSYAPNTYDECAGLKEIHFHGPGTGAKFSYDENICSVEESFSISSQNLTEGKHTINVDMTDYMGNSDSGEFTISVDRSGPSFSNVRIISDNDEEISHIGHDFIHAAVAADVSGDAVASTIKADLSALNDKEDYSEYEPECVREKSILKCRWQVKIAPTAYGAKSLHFKAEDDIGNYNEKTVTKLIQRDIEGPRALSIRTAGRTNNMDYLKRYNNTIMVLFSETGAGLSPENVFLDLGELGNAAKISADECIQGWKCYWKNLNFDAADGLYDIKVHPQTADRLGNKLKAGFSGQAALDTSAPQLISIEINAIGGGLTNYEGFATYGDSLEVIAKIHEPGTIRDAYADFSAFISDAYLVQADDCIDINGTWECRWISDPIDLEGYIRDRARLSFIDYLGNKAEFEKEVTVYAIEDALVDYWRHSVVCTPDAIDREVASIIDQKVYCHVGLRGNAETVAINLEECEGDADIYIRKQELLNSQQGSKNPYIRLTLNAADIKADRLNLKCPLAIISQSGSSVTGIPEIETVSINVPFYNFPLGEYGKNVEQKIEEAVDDANGGIWKVVTALNKLVFYSERICSLITTINNIASLFNIIGEYEGLVANALKTNPATAAAGEAMEQKRQYDQSITAQLNNQMKQDWLLGREDGEGFINKFCKFVSCRLYYDELGWGALKGAGEWQRKVLDTANSIATAGGANVPLFNIQLGGRGINAYTIEGPDQRGTVSPKKVLQGGRLNPKDSLVISMLTLCIPGIVYNLDKYRQIKCMYADCLKTSVETGVPIHACEDAKEYETCKYVYGEVFQLLPFTGLLDYFIGLVKNILYSPFGVVDIAIGHMCMQPVTTPGAATVAKLCLWQEIAGMIADIWSDLSNIKDDWKIKLDYCERIEEDKENKEGDKSSFMGGLFG
ncbi:hypothetical protein GF323_01475 [Candidatus Woesearchaeota archaeon]|nr:hypothetical protein [Candidatus Woesearchaeota archaeon]